MVSVVLYELVGRNLPLWNISSTEHAHARCDHCSIEIGGVSPLPCITMVPRPTGGEVRPAFYRMVRCVLLIWLGFLLRRFFSGVLLSPAS